MAQVSPNPPHPAAAHVPPDLDNFSTPAAITAAPGATSTVLNSSSLQTSQNQTENGTKSSVQEQNKQVVFNAHTASPTTDFSHLQMQWQQQMDAQRQAFERQLAAKDAEMATLRTQAEVGLKARREAEINALLNGQLEELEYVTPEAAAEMRDKVLRPIINGVLQRTDELVNGFKTEFSQTRTEEQEQRKAARLAKVNEALFAKHPDLNQMMANPAYADFMRQTIPGTRVTYGSQVSAAYEAGDTDYVVSILDKFKGAQPSLEQVATPSTVQHQGALHPATPTETYSYEDLADWRHQFQTGVITREEYIRRTEEFNKAQAEGRVR